MRNVGGPADPTQEVSVYGALKPAAAEGAGTCLLLKHVAAANGKRTWLGRSYSSAQQIHVCGSNMLLSSSCACGAGRPPPPSSRCANARSAACRLWLVAPPTMACICVDAVRAHQAAHTGSGPKGPKQPPLHINMMHVMQRTSYNRHWQLATAKAPQQGCPAAEEGVWPYEASTDLDACG